MIVMKFLIPGQFVNTTIKSTTRSHSKLVTFLLFLNNYFIRLFLACVTFIENDWTLKANDSSTSNCKTTCRNEHYHWSYANQTNCYCSDILISGLMNIFTCLKCYFSYFIKELSLMKNVIWRPQLTQLDYGL